MAPLPASAEFLNNTNLAVRDTLATSELLTSFWERPPPPLSLAQRKLVVAQALTLIADNYVHLPMKRTIHAVDPVQSLKMLQYELDAATAATMGSVTAFHNEMLRIFSTVRDLHTSYWLPPPHADSTAYLPFDIEEYFEGDVAHYQVTHITEGFSHPSFAKGVEVLAWSGIPIARAIEISADRRAGSNKAARHARGIQYLTQRPLQKSMTPDEAWVDIDYVGLDGTSQTLRFDWLVLGPNVDMASGDAEGDADATSLMAIDEELEIANRMKRVLFAPEVIAESRGQRRTARAAGDIEVRPAFVPNIEARSVTTAQGDVGVLRIWSFKFEPTSLWAGFVSEVARLLPLLPKDKLIIDLRGNPGGIVSAAETLLQFFTPRQIVPAPNQFIVTPLNRLLCANNTDFAAWLPSIDEAKFTGATYSGTVPLTPPRQVNSVGQLYRGRVACVVDAKSFSSSDIFAAAFQDHEIGPVVGTDEVTGAGGANVWLHSSLLAKLPSAVSGSPYKALPDGMEMRIALRRTQRVGTHAGEIVEDLGVKPDHLWKMTRSDLNNRNAELVAFCAGILDALPLRTLEVSRGTASGGELPITVASKNVSRLDVYVDGRPFGSQDVSAGTVVVKVPASARMVKFEGFSDSQLVISNRLKIS